MSRKIKHRSQAQWRHNAGHLIPSNRFLLLQSVLKCPKTQSQSLPSSAKLPVIEAVKDFRAQPVPDDDQSRIKIDAVDAIIGRQNRQLCQTCEPSSPPRLGLYAVGFARAKSAATHLTAPIWDCHPPRAADQLPEFPNNDPTLWCNVPKVDPNAINAASSVWAAD
jgi:hypothetical protein